MRSILKVIHRLAVFGILALLCFPACDSNKPAGQTHPDGGAGPEGGMDPDGATDAHADAVVDAAVDADAAVPFTVSDFAVQENPANSLSFYVSWSTDIPVHTDLSVDCGNEYSRTFRDDVAKTDHQVFVMGLIAGLSCTFTAYQGRTDVDGSREHTVNGVGSLPSFLPDLDVNTLDAARMQPGWTLWSVASATQALDVIIVVIDAQGRYRWYYVLPTQRSGAGAEVTLVEDGILIGNAEAQSQIASWEGYPVWLLSHPAHHDLTMSPFNARHVLTLGHSNVNCSTNEHTAVEIDMTTRTVVWEWRVCEYWTPRVLYSNWSHLNAIEPVPGERAVLVSSRNQDALFKVNRDTGELEWALGMDGDFQMDPSAYFFRQHSSRFLPDGTILLLDNGLNQAEAQLDGLAPREYSRALQFELTFDANGLPDRANVVWEYTDTSIFAVNRSDADRLANGNTLIHFVWVQPDRRTILREVTANGEIVWDVSTPPDISSYRSERIEPNFGYIIHGNP